VDDYDLGEVEEVNNEPVVKKTGNCLRTSL
jgi:hypothetical protein